MLYHKLLYPDGQESWWWNTTNSQELVVILQKDKNSSEWYDEQINILEQAVAKVKNIILEYTSEWSNHQSVYNSKMKTIQELQTEYERIRWEHMSDDEKTAFEEQKQREQEMRQHIFSGMGFDQQGMWGEFTSEEDFFQHYQKEQKKATDANYVKKNMEEVTGELVEQLKNLSLKTIYRRINLALHADRLIQNPEVAPHEDYLKYLHGVHQQVIEAWEKEDKAAMIMIIQDAGIRYEDPNFILASYQDFQNIAIYANKKTLIQELQDRLHALKASYIYVFYLKHTQGETQKELRELDDKIQELEDLIVSYKQSDEQPNPVQ